VSKTVLIVTGESSGELYGALLASSIKARWPEARVLGVGGERMREAGVEMIAGISGAFGLTEAVSSYGALRRTFEKTVATLRDSSPDVAVLIDYPEFNFRVARKARAMGVKVLYYVSPQVWAWRKGRVKTLAALADRIAVVLPFEEEIYRRAGVECEFVGHPAGDDISSVPRDKRTARTLLGLDAERPLVALLPGSRHHELRRLLPVMRETAGRFMREFPNVGLVMPLAPNIEEKRYEGALKELKEQGVAVVTGNALLALAASEAAVVASGTATLQAALLEIPTVVVYKVFPLTYLVGKLILKVRYITLANLLLGREALPELIQGRARPDEIMEQLRALLGDAGRREEMLSALKAVKGLFEGRRPSERVAEMVGEMAGWNASAVPSNGGRPQASLRPKGAGPRPSEKA
jgi:lipid-A-disaccharide synthase